MSVPRVFLYSVARTQQAVRHAHLQCPGCKHLSIAFSLLGKHIYFNPNPSLSLTARQSIFSSFSLEEYRYSDSILKHVLATGNLAQSSPRQESFITRFVAPMAGMR